MITTGNAYVQTEDGVYNTILIALSDTLMLDVLRGKTYSVTAGSTETANLSLITRDTSPSAYAPGTVVSIDGISYWVGGMGTFTITDGEDVLSLFLLHPMSPDAPQSGPVILNYLDTTTGPFESVQFTEVQRYVPQDGGTALPLQIALRSDPLRVLVSVGTNGTDQLMAESAAPGSVEGTGFMTTLADLTTISLLFREITGVSNISAGDTFVGPDGVTYFAILGPIGETISVANFRRILGVPIAGPTPNVELRRQCFPLNLVRKLSSGI